MSGSHPGSKSAGSSSTIRRNEIWLAFNRPWPWPPAIVSQQRQVAPSGHYSP
jgi:hypothetical protein